MRTRLTIYFKRNFKRLAKRYPSLISDFSALSDIIADKPTAEANHLGNDVYKIRMRIASKNTGKSGGARVIVAFKYEHDLRIFLAIYDKSEKYSVSESEFVALNYDLKEMLDSLEEDE